MPHLACKDRFRACKDRIGQPAEAGMNLRLQSDALRLQKLIRCGVLTLLAFFSLTSATEAQGGRKLAVIVGVDTYRAASGLSRLQHAGNDAVKLSEALRNAGFTVIEMTHAAARKPGGEVLAPSLDYIRDQISGVLDFPNLGENDTVLIALHGHGVQFDRIQKDADGTGKRTPQFYFCPADATIDGIKTASELTERNHLLPLDELYEQLAECRAATKLLIVDACRNDPTQPAMFRQGLASATLPKLPPPPGGTAALFSCQAGQRAVEDAELSQGVFTYFLIQGLEGQADLPVLGRPGDGVITLSELTTYVSSHTFAYVFEKYRGVKQSPELKGEFDANVPLVRVRKAADRKNIPPQAVAVQPRPAVVPPQQPPAPQQGKTQPPLEAGKAPIPNVPKWAQLGLKQQYLRRDQFQSVYTSDIRVHDEWRYRLLETAATTFGTSSIAVAGGRGADLYVGGQVTGRLNPSELVLVAERRGDWVWICRDSTVMPYFPRDSVSRGAQGQTFPKVTAWVHRSELLFRNAE